MTPGQLSIVAAMHAVANGEPDRSPSSAPTTQGTNADLMAFAALPAH